MKEAKLDGMEGRLITSMYQMVGEMEDKLRRIYALTTELGFQRTVTVGSRSCDLICYYLQKLEQHEVETHSISFVNHEKKQAFGMYIPRLEYLLERSQPFCEHVNEDGFLLDPTSKDFVVNHNMQWMLFQIYEKTYNQRKKGWDVFVREDGRIVDHLDVDPFYRGENSGTDSYRK